MSRRAGVLVNRVLALGSAAGTVIGRDVNLARVPRLLGIRVGSRTVLCAQALGADVELGSDVRVGRHVRIGDRVTIGRGCVIHERAVIGPDVVIGAGCSVGAGARLSRITIGDGSSVETGLLCLGYGDGRIVIGSESYIGVSTVLDWSADLVIGDHVHIAGPSTGLWTHSSVRQALHGDRLDDKARRTVGPIFIGDRVWLGGNCTVYPDTTVESGSVVLPNSAVHRDIPAGVVAGGVPVRILRPAGAEERADA